MRFSPRKIVEEQKQKLQQLAKQKMTAQGMKWLKGFHLLAVACWIGGGIALFMLYFLKIQPLNGGVLYGMNEAYHHVDISVVIIPGAFGCLVTGILYGVFTKWGFFKHYWLIFKWVLTVAGIFFGIFFLSSWENTMLELSSVMSLNVLSDESYVDSEKKLFVFGTIQTLLLITTVFISIFKPWKRKAAKVAETVDEGAELDEIAESAEVTEAADQAFIRE